MKKMHFIAPRGNIVNVNLAAGVGNRIVRGVQCNYHGMHLSVNVAKDERNSWLFELHKARGAAFIESKIEALSIEQGKDVVKERVAIGKLHFAPRGND